MDDLTEDRSHDEANHNASPSVTVVVPVLNEVKYIGRCVESILNQDYPQDRLDVVIVDGMSTDGTRELIQELMLRDDRISLVDNPQVIQSAGMNLGVAHSRSSFICRLDAKSWVDPDYVSKCVLTAQRTGAGNLGGRRVSVGTGRKQEGIAWGMSSRYGASHYAYSTVGGSVQTIYPGFIRRDAGEAIGWFDEHVGVHEDFDFNTRLRASGRDVYMDPDIVIYYSPRENLRKLTIQYFRYGRSKSSLARQGRPVVSLRNLIAPLFVVSVILLVITSVVIGTPLPILAYLVLYFSTLFVLAIPRGVRSPVEVFATTSARVIALSCMHFSWGTGFLVGLLRRSTYTVFDE